MLAYDFGYLTKQALSFKNLFQPEQPGKPGTSWGYLEPKPVLPPTVSPLPSVGIPHATYIPETSAPMEDFRKLQMKEMRTPPSMFGRPPTGEFFIGSESKPYTVKGVTIGGEPVGRFRANINPELLASAAQKNKPFFGIQNVAGQRTRVRITPEVARKIQSAQIAPPMPVINKNYRVRRAFGKAFTGPGARAWRAPGYAGLGAAAFLGLMHYLSERNLGRQSPQKAELSEWNVRKTMA